MECKHCGDVDVEPASRARWLLVGVMYVVTAAMGVTLGVFPPWGFFLLPVLAPGLMGALAMAHDWAAEEPLCPHCGRIVSFKVVQPRAVVVAPQAQVLRS